jgi:hypothetical protein
MTNNFTNGQKVKDCHGKIVVVVGDPQPWDCSIKTTGGNYHPTKIFPAA